MGTNRREGQQESADETGRDPDRLPKGAGKEKGDGSSRPRSSEEPSEDREKQVVVEKPKGREQE